MKHEMYVKIVGEPFLSKARAYRDDLQACADKWRSFMDEMGASGVPHCLGGLNFDGAAPKGWTKPTRKNGFSRPKDGHPDNERIAALPKRPRTYEVFGDSIINDLSYKGQNGDRGSGGILFYWDGPWVGWAGDTFMACIPDAKAASDAHLAEHPDHEITSGADKWVLPQGLEQISRAEHDLIIAQYKVEQERKAA